MVHVPGIYSQKRRAWFISECKCEFENVCLYIRWNDGRQSISLPVSCLCLCSQEEPFEWGNPAAVNYMKAAALSANEETIVNAAYRWRKKVQTTHMGAFHKFRAILRTSKNTQLRTLIEAGDGKVIDVPE